MPPRWVSYKLISVVLFLSLVWSLAPGLGHGADGAAVQERSAIHEMEVKILNAILKRNIPRRFDFSHADFSLLSGINIVIKQLKVSENPVFSNHPLKDYDKFYTDETMRVSVKALPLFVAKVNMKEMHMEKPFFHVLRNKKKELSVDDLFKGNKGPVLGWLNVDQWTISKGALRFIDAAAPRGPFTATFNDLNASISGLSVHEIFKVNISLKGPGSPGPNCFFNGTAGPINDISNFSQVPVNMEFRVKEARIAPYAAYAPPGLPFPLSGQLSIDYRIDGDVWTGLHMKGVSTVRNLVLSSDDGRAQKSVPFTLGISLLQGVVFSMKEDRLMFENVEMQMNHSIFTINGNISQLSKDPTMDIRVATGSVDLDDIKRIYPFLQEYIPERFIYAGRSGMSLHMKGDQEKVILFGRVDLSETLLEVSGFVKKKSSEKFLIEMEAALFPRTKRFEGTGRLQSGQVEIFTPKGYQRFKDALSRHFNLAQDPQSSGGDFSKAPVIAESMEGEITFLDDQILFENMMLKNCRQGSKEGIDAVVSGWVDVAEKRLFLSGEAILSQKESAAIFSAARNGESPHLPDANGRFHTPITISGAIENPAIQIDKTTL